MPEIQTNEIIDQIINQLAEDIPESIKQAFDKEVVNLRVKISKTIELILSHPSNTKPDIEGIVKSKVDEWVKFKFLQLHYVRYCKLMHAVGKKPVSIKRFGYATKLQVAVIARFLCYEKRNLSIGSIVNVSQGSNQFVGEISGITGNFYLQMKKDGERVKGLFSPHGVELV